MILILSYLLKIENIINIIIAFHVRHALDYFVVFCGLLLFFFIDVDVEVLARGTVGFTGRYPLNMTLDIDSCSNLWVIYSLFQRRKV